MAPNSKNPKFPIQIPIARKQAWRSSFLEICIVVTAQSKWKQVNVEHLKLNFSVPIYLRQTQLTEEHKLNIIVRSFEISIAETKITQLILKAFTYMLVAASDIWQTL